MFCNNITLQKLKLDLTMEQSTISKKKPSQASEQEFLRALGKNLKNKYINTVPPTIEESAQQCGVSTSKFKSLFRKMYGETYYNFFLKHKLELAAQLLKEGHKLVDVSKLVGYSQPIKFLLVFKKYYGVNTKEFVRRHHATSVESTK
jgi:AraC-like DNA-binding protein